MTTNDENLKAANDIITAKLKDRQMISADHRPILALEAIADELLRIRSVLQDINAAMPDKGSAP